MSPKPIIVKASEVENSAFCAHSISLKYSGHHINYSARKRLVISTLKHEELNLAIDKRCYIATHVWGEMMPKHGILDGIEMKF